MWSSAAKEVLLTHKGTTLPDGETPWLEGRTRPRIAPKKSLTSLLKPIENDDWSYFCLLLLKRCCSPTTKSLTSLLKPIEHEDFSYFCLLLLKRCCSPTKTPPSRTGKHHGPEGRTSPRSAPKNSLTSLLKPIENDVMMMILATFVFFWNP